MENLGSILAFIGLGLMVGLSGFGCALGVGNVCSTVIGSLKKRPDAFGSGLVLTAVPSTQGLYGFVGFVVFQSLLVQMGANIPVHIGAIVLGSGIMLGLVCFMSAISQASVCASGVNAIGNGHNVFGNTLILIAFPEFFAIISLVGAIIASQMITQ